MGFSSAIRTTRRRISISTPRRDGPCAYVHLRATSCRCQRSKVSGVTMVAISRSRRRPSRCMRGWRAGAGRHRSAAGVGPAAGGAGGDILRPDSGARPALGDPTSPSGRRAAAGERRHRSRPESRSRAGISRRPPSIQPWDTTRSSYRLDACRARTNSPDVILADHTGVAGSSPGRANVFGSIPETWVTDHSGPSVRIVVACSRTSRGSEGLIFSTGTQCVRPYTR